MSPESTANLSMPTPAPEVNPETEPFWEATAQGKLLLKRCLDCQEYIYYPRSHCPECSSLNTEWVEASGRGTVYTFTINHKGEAEYTGGPPFVLAYVALEEGPKMMTNIVDSDFAQIAIDSPVEVVFHDTGHGTSLPRFRLS